MSAAPWWEILTVLAHTLHLAMKGSPGTAEMNGHVFVHSLLNFVLYLKAPEYLDFSIILRRFGELASKSSFSERFGPLSVSEDVSNSAITVSKPLVIIVRLRQCNGKTSKRVIRIERNSAGAKCAYLEYGP